MDKQPLLAKEIQAVLAQPFGLTLPHDFRL